MTVQQNLDATINAYLKICEENAVDPNDVAIDPATMDALDAIGYLNN